MGDGLKIPLQIRQRHQSVVLSKLISFQAMTKEVCLPSMGVAQYENELPGDSQAGSGVRVSSGCRVVGFCRWYGSYGTGAQILRSGKGLTVPDPCEPDELETTVTRATRQS